MSRSRLIVPAAFCIALVAAGCHRPIGAKPQQFLHWTGNIGPGTPTRLIIDLHRGPGQTNATTFSLPDLGQGGFEFSSVILREDTVHLSAPTPQAPFVFDGRPRGDTIAGTFAFGKLTGPFQLTRSATPRPFYREEQVSFRNGDVALSGVVLIPLTRGRHPALVTLHGSGVETRSGGRFMAEHFVRLGVVVLLYDKRGTGRSTGSLQGATLDDLAGDAAAAFRMLQARPDVDSGRVGIWGSSQAGWVAAIAADRLENVAFMLIKSGPLTTVAREAHYDTELLLRRKGFDGAVLEKAEHILELDDAVTRDPAGWARLVAAIDSVKTEPWFQAMEFKPLSPHAPARGEYRQRFDFDPVPLLRRSAIPTLWVYAEHDETMPAVRSARLAEQLRAEGKPYTIRTLPGTSHAMLLSPRPGEVWPRLSPEYVPLMTNWLKQQLQTSTDQSRAEQ